MGDRSEDRTRRGIVRLSLLALALIVASAGALIAYTWAELNRAEAQQETLLVERKVDRNLMRLRQETTSATAWDEAYLKTADHLDADWIDEKLAGYYHLSFEHDVTLLFDAKGAMTYAARDGERAPLAQEMDLARVVAASVLRVQAAELRRRGDGTPISPREARDIAQRSVIVAADGRPYLVAVAAMLPSNGRLEGRRPATVVVTGWALNARLLATVADDVGVRNLRFEPGGPTDRARGAVALHDPEGRRLGVLTWTLGRPGVEALRDVVWPGLAGAFLLCAVFGLLGWRVRRLLQDLRTQDEVLQASLVALTQARDEAQAASIAKSEFIANISHEIRTPLNGVLGMAQVMACDDLSAPQHQRLQVITQSGEALLTVLNDVLDMSKIEAGRIEIVDAPFDLDEVMAGVCQTYAGVAEAKGVRLQWGTADAAGAWDGDADRVRQILLNLVSNAVKFTGQGRVLVAAQATRTGLRVSVHDEGIGIPAAKRLELFTAFSQVDNSRTRRFGGTGLGLAISRRLARLMGGDITVESTDGEGSVFCLELPLRRASARPTRPAAGRAFPMPVLRRQVLAGPPSDEAEPPSSRRPALAAEPSQN